MGKRQYTTPVVVSEGKAVLLSVISPQQIPHDEDWFQNLLFSCPTLLPIDDIEPGFGDLVPIARELPTSRGPLDILFVDADGHLILIETKLWRNPDARRKVVGQIVDYATAISKWNYIELVAAVRDALNSTADDPFLDLVRARIGPDFDESRFIDAVTLNLARGRFLLLIVGDGIHEGVEQMVEFLDRYPQLGFRLGLVEIGLYRLGQASDLYVQPRVTAATREVVRAVVEISAGIDSKGVVVKPPTMTVECAGRSTPVSRSSISEEDFYARLREVKPELASLVAETIRAAPSHGLQVDWKKDGPILKYFDDSGEFLNFGQLTPRGTLGSSVWLSMKSNRLGLPDSVWRDYYKTVLLLLKGAKLVEDEEADVPGKNWCFADGNRNDPEIEPLVRQREKWFSAIEASIARAKAAFSKLSE